MKLVIIILALSLSFDQRSWAPKGTHEPREVEKLKLEVSQNAYQTLQLN